MEEAFSQVEARELPEHLEEALVRRLVESVELDLLDAHGIDPLPAPISAAARRGTFAPASRPWSCETICSTGPPGTNWTITKVIVKIPSNVGIIKQPCQNVRPHGYFFLHQVEMTQSSAW